MAILNSRRRRRGLLVMADMGNFYLEATGLFVEWWNTVLVNAFMEEDRLLQGVL